MPPTSDPVADCQCGVDAAGLRLPGIAALPSCSSGCVDGGALAQLLGTIDPAELLTDAQVLDLATAWHRVASWSQARGLRAVAEFARRPESVPGSDPVAARAGRHRLGQVARWHTEAELGAALSMSPDAAGRRLMTACV